ncbi:hypothetical protein FRC04_007992 [Tulasnella sp. 424]|nr:hypothetical protein FRC04_007992 [Tulasnella sp. 424]KAG8974849.1 hypothetical protein FRC05_006782 [Tulasnella sp. 425]
MTEDRLSPKSLGVLHKLVEKYGGIIFPAIHTIINLSPRDSIGTFRLIASPVVTHVEITDRLKHRGTGRTSQSDDLLDSMGQAIPNLRLLTLSGLPSEAFDFSLFQNLHEFRYHSESFRLGSWVDLSGCPLLESVWLSFRWGNLSRAADSQPVTFLALRHLTVAAKGEEDVVELAKISVMPSLQTAVFFVPMSLESRNTLLAHLRSATSSTCEVEVEDGVQEEEMRRIHPSPSDQLYSNGNFWPWTAGSGESVYDEAKKRRF